MENSSTITSEHATYVKVPAAMARKMPLTMIDEAEMIQPMINPSGLVDENRMIMITAVLGSILLLLKLTPNVRPSAHLWIPTARTRFRTSPRSFWMPMAMPSKIPWKDSARRSRYGVIAEAFPCP